MPSAITTTFFLFLSLAFASADSPSRLVPRQSCSDNYSKCSPSGATTTVAPPVGPALSSMYVDLLDSINPAKTRKRDARHGLDVLDIRSSSADVCCADGTQCLLLDNLNLPFCYDNYTTNYFLPDGSSGNIVAGSYTSNDSTANLLSGDYTLANGTAGNIYGSDSSPSKPNTATLTLPTVYTSAGVGSAIPLSALGEIATFTTTIPGTTVQPTTVPAQTISTSVVSSGSTVVSEITEAATTVPGTTVAAKTSVITTKVAAASTASTKAANVGAPMDAAPVAGIAGLGFLLFAIFAL
ncbi:hypothetical protein MMC12_004616 [Toensbergia leucococca]|nr:hypothetical protein [Toensbergia leucococca]